MLHVGLDLSRTRVDVHVLNDEGATVEATAGSCDEGGLEDLAWRIARHGHPEIRGVVESMTGARFVHDTLERHGWDVEVVDAYRVKGFGPVAAKTDKIDAWMLAELSRRDLLPTIWLPSLEIRQGRELVRYRHHLVKHRTMLKNRIHATLISHGIVTRSADLFGVAGRRRLTEYPLGDTWRHTTDTTLAVIDTLDTHIETLDIEIRRRATRDPNTQLLMTAPGIGPLLGYTIAVEIGDIGRFAAAKNLVGYTGLVPKVHQSGETDWRGSVTRHGPGLLRWAYIEATTWAQKHPAYQQRHQRIRTRRGTHQGAAIARIDTARRLATATWWMLTRNQPFDPQGPTLPLVA